MTPSKRPEITTRLPSICPSTFAPSPSTTVCSEIMLPFTLPSMRNVPLTVSVPSSVTPWSINPVHSSLFDAPFLSPAAHFHAMSSSPKSFDTSTLMGPGNKSTQQKNPVVETKTERRDSWRTGNFPQREKLFHQAIVEAHQLGVVVKLKHQLARAHLGSQVQNDSRAQVTLQLFERGANVWIQVPRRGRLLRAFSLGAARGEFFDLADRQCSPRGAVRVTHAKLLFRHRQQSSAMTCRQLPFFDPLLNLLLEFEQANRIGYRGAIFSSSFGDRFLRQVKFIHQPLERARSLHGVQVFALDVFDERHLEGKLVGNLPDDGGDSVQTCALCGTPATFAGDELKSGTDWADNQGLNDAARFDGARKFVESLLMKSRARLIRARLDQVNINFLGTALYGLARRHSRGGATCSGWLRLWRFGRWFGLLSFKLPNKRSESPSQSVPCHWRSPP